MADMTTTVDVSKTVTVRVKVLPRFLGIRAWSGLRIMRFGAWVGGAYKIEVDTQAQG